MPWKSADRYLWVKKTDLYHWQSMLTQKGKNRYIQDDWLWGDPSFGFYQRDRRKFYRASKWEAYVNHRNKPRPNYDFYRFQRELSSGSKMC